jgi:DNA polymerase I - 3''-5'' exonuclease and polymerase domains
MDSIIYSRPEVDYAYITKQKEADAVAKDLLKCKSVGCDTEGTGKSWKRDKIVLLQFNTGKRIYLVDRRTTHPHTFKTFYESPKIEKIFHNFQHDGCQLKFDMGIQVRNVYDSMVQEGVMLGAVLDESIRKDLLFKYKNDFSVALEHCLKRRGLPDKLEFESFYWFEPMVKVERKFGRGKQAQYHIIDMPLDVWDKSLGKIKEQYDGKELYQFKSKQLDYSAVDVQHLFAIQEDQQSKISQLGLDMVSNLENKVATVFTKMSTNGMGLDTKQWTKIANKHEAEYNGIIADLNAQVKFAGHEDVSWSSPKQYCKFFRDYFDNQELNKIDDIRYFFKSGKVDDAILNTFMEAQERQGMVTKYGLKYLDHVIDGRVHTSFRQLVNTGRCSSKDPNLQNTPTKITHYLPDGRREFIKVEHRRCFIPSYYKNGIFGIADFSGQELAIMAYGSQEPVWLETLRAGKDLHLKCAELIFGYEVVHRSEKDKKFYRGLAKTLNFTIAYGGGVSVIADRAMVSEEIAADALKRYKKTFPRLMAWLYKNAEFSVAHHVSYTFEPFQRMRKLVFEPEEWRRANIGKNNPVQGTGADMTKLAMIYMDEALEDFDALMITQQHDELVNETSKKNGTKLKGLMEECMRDACTAILGEPLSQPEVHLATNWYKD